MMTQFDINLLALARQAGNDQPGLPGFYAVTPPRRSARGRTDDYLILLLSCTGGAPFPTNLQEQWFEQVSRVFYQTLGSATAALRAAAGALNQLLFDRALRGAGARQGLGVLTLAVVRGEQIILAQCGPQHAFVLAPDRFEHFTDPENVGNGLGVSRTVAIRFFQAALHSNECILVTHELPSGWDDLALQGVYGQGLEGLRRRLLGTAGPQVGAILIQVQAGNGHMRLLKPKPVAAPAPADLPAAPEATSPPASPPAVSLPAPTSPGAEGAAVPAAAEVLITPPPAASPPPQTPVQEAGTAAPVPGEPPPAPQEHTPPVGEKPGAAQAAISSVVSPKPLPPSPAASGRTVSPNSSAAASSPRRLNDRTPAKPVQPRKSFAAVAAAPVRKAFAALGRAGQTVANGLRSLLKRILPDEGLFHLSSSTMIFFAVAIPVIIGLVGAMMYLERGRSLQYQSYYNYAFDRAVDAGKLQNPADQRSEWGIVLTYLNTAESFRTTADSKALRLKAQQALDQIEHVTRVDMQPAIRGELDKSVQVGRIIATNDALYLLNTTYGNVMRAIYTGKGYEVDPNFRCGKGTYGTIVVGPPVGLVALPTGNANQADILGIDENGDRMYCGASSDLPLAKRVSLPPLWQTPSAIALNPDNLNLYVLDVPANQVWIYQNEEKAEELLPFFDENNPPSLADVIDIASASGDLFLLHKDGQVSRCTYGSIDVIVTRCVPVTFTNLPGGRPDGNTISGTQLWQLVYAPPPGPSLYLLDASNQSILHMSLLGNFQDQFRSQNPLPAQPAVALAISPRRAVFVAVGNQIYYTNLP